MRQDHGERKTSWPARLFITGVVLFVASGVVYFVHGKTDPRYSTYMGRAPAPPDYTRAGVGDRLVLRKDQDCRLQDLNLIFRGVEDGRLRFDAFLLQLDPASAYVHSIDPDLAEHGFNMGGKTFRLLNWNRTQVRLEMIRPQ